MVNRTKDTNVYSRTNKILLDTLNKAIGQEKKNILTLSKKEKVLKSLVARESKRLSKNKLHDKNKELSYRILSYKSSLENTKELLKDKKQLISHSNRALESLKNQIAEKSLDQTKVEKDLEKSLQLLLKLRKEEAARTKKKAKKIDQQLKSLYVEKRQAERHYSKIINDLKKKHFDSRDPVFGGVLKKGKAQLQRMNKANSALRKSSSKEVNIIKEEISQVDRELLQLERSLSTVALKVQKEEYELSDLESLQQKYQKIRSNIKDQQERLSNLQSHIKTWTKKQQKTKKAISSERMSLSEQRKHKKAIAEQFGIELAGMSKKFKSLMLDHQKRLKNIKFHIKAVEDKRNNALRTLGSDKIKLVGLENKIYALGEQLSSRERSDEAKVRFLLMDIKEQKRQVQAGKTKLKQVGVLLQQVRKMSMTSPEVLRSFKSEKSVVESSLKELKKSILHKEQEVKNVRNLLEQFQKQLNRKIRSVKSLQKQAIQQQQSHHSQLTEINKELKLLQGMLNKESARVVADSGRNQSKVGSKQLELDREIGKINLMIKAACRKTDTYMKTRKNQEKTLLLLQNSASQTVKNLHNNKNLFDKYSRKLHAARIKDKALEHEEILLQKIVNKIEDEKKVKYALSKSLRMTQAQSNRRKDRLAKNISAYITKLKSSLAEQEQEHLRGYSSKIDNQLREKRKLYSALRREEKKLIARMGSKRKLSANKKANLAKKIKQNKAEVRKASEEISHSLKRSRELNSRIKSLYSRIDDSKKKKKEISSLFSIRDGHLKQLNGLVKNKMQLIEERNLLKDELHRLHQAIDQIIMVCPVRTKTKIKVETKYRTRIKTKIKTKIIKQIQKIQVTKDIKGMKPALKAIDDLLGKLPPEEIKKFSKSKEFQIYKKLMNKYGVK